MFKAYRLEVVRTRIAQPQAPLNCTHHVVQRYAHLTNRDREHLIRLDLDSRNRLVGEETVSVGTVNASLVHPREVFKGAILNSATRIIVLHNHPGGNPEPSDEDLQIHQRLKEAGELLGIPLLDFLIIGEDGTYWSPDDGVGRLPTLTNASPTNVGEGK